MWAENNKVYPGGVVLYLFDAQLLHGHAHNLADGLSEVVQLHGEEVLQSEGVRVHVELLASFCHQVLPVTKREKVEMSVGGQ